MSELVAVQTLLEEKIFDGVGQYEATIALADQLNVSKATIYKWLRDGNMYVENGVVGNDDCAIYRMVKYINS